MIETPQIITGYANAAMIELGVIRLMCQPSAGVVEDEDSNPQWLLGLKPPRPEDVTSEGEQSYRLVADYSLHHDGWLIGGTVQLLFVTHEECPNQESASEVWDQFLALHARWANQVMWDHLVLALRSMLAQLAYASQVLTIPTLPPALTLLHYEIDSNDKR